jgi:hypothetical protein
MTAVKRKKLCKDLTVTLDALVRNGSFNYHQIPLPASMSEWIPFLSLPAGWVVRSKLCRNLSDIFSTQNFQLERCLFLALGEKASMITADKLTQSHFYLFTELLGNSATEQRNNSLKTKLTFNMNIVVNINPKRTLLV